MEFRNESYLSYKFTSTTVKRGVLRDPPPPERIFKVTIFLYKLGKVKKNDNISELGGIIEYFRNNESMLHNNEVYYGFSIS